MVGTELKILMLEDLEDDVGLIEHTLRKDKINFITKQVDTEEEFVSALETYKPDLILSDHALPQFNSVEALKICKKKGLDIPFILVTGTVSEEFAVSCLRHGADDYVLKSNLARLPSAINNSLKKRYVEAQRRAAEIALRNQNEELIKINKELDSFVYSVSHNLRAPLMSVLGLINLAQIEDTKCSGVMSTYFELMENSINRLDDTLKEILDYSRNARSNVQVEIIDIRKLIDDCFSRMQYLDGYDDIKKDINVEGSCSMVSDPYRVTVIFNNLISNAIKYRDTLKSNPYIKINVNITLEKVSITFSDNGIGIKQPLINRIFDMFFRATEKSEGAGLGLYIVKEAIEKLDGSMEVSSVLGEGTTFGFEFPNRLQFVPVELNEQES
jgi:signal transduction histidine kinase